MAEKREPSPKVDSPHKKSPIWVYDERLGWIDVSEFLSRTIKLREELARKINNPGKK